MFAKQPVADGSSGGRSRTLKNYLPSFSRIHLCSEAPAMGCSCGATRVQIRLRIWPV